LLVISSINSFPSVFIPHYLQLLKKKGHTYEFIDDQEEEKNKNKNNKNGQETVKEIIEAFLRSLI